MNKTLDKSNTPFDYSNSKIWIEFEIGDKELGTQILRNIDYIDTKDIIPLKFGFKVLICNQQIPELVRLFISSNIAIYQIRRTS